MVVLQSSTEQDMSGQGRARQCSAVQGRAELDSRGPTFQGILKGGMRGRDVAWTSTPSTVMLAGGVWSAGIGFSMTLVEGKAW